MLTTSSPPAPRTGWFLGLVLTGMLAGAAFYLATWPVLKVMGTLSVALMLGLAWRAAAGLPAESHAGVRFSARTLLRLGIVLMGARLNYGLVASAGPKILIVDLAVITAGLSGIYWLGRRFGLRRELALMLAVGSSICGASAVAAAASVTRSDEEATTLAVALCGILGTIGVFAYVALGTHLGLPPRALGILAGSTLHEVAQVMAAAFTWGTQSSELGTLVKLTRVVLLAPALLIVGALYNRGEGASGRGSSYSWSNPPVPYFVLGFLGLGGVNSAGWLTGTAQNALTQGSLFLMALAMAGMGLNTDLRLVRQSGTGAFAVGLIGFACLGLLSFTLIHLLGLTGP